MHLKNQRCPFGSAGARCEEPHEENLHPGSHVGKRQSASGCKGAILGPTSYFIYGLHPGNPQPPSRGTWLRQRGVAAARQNQLSGEKGGQRGQDKRPGETLLAGPAWLRPHDFAAASPNISFHGNPGETRGAFILASEFTLS